MADYNYTRILSEDCGWLPGTGLVAAIQEALPGKPFTTSASGAALVLSFDPALSGAEVTILNGVVTAESGGAELALVKAAKFSAIDSRTEELILEGFSFAAKVFSLSSNAQSYWNGLANLISNNMLVEPTDFPIILNTLTDGSTHSLQTITECLQFFGTASGTVKGRLESGTALKTEVRAATTVAEVNAIVDNR